MKYLAVLWLLAYAEEFLWDVGVWHERSWLFGSPQDWSAYHSVLLPILAVPQITHYVLDGFIWRRNASSTFEAHKTAIDRPPTKSQHNPVHSSGNTG